MKSSEICKFHVASIHLVFPSRLKGISNILLHLLLISLWVFLLFLFKVYWGDNG